MWMKVGKKKAKVKVNVVVVDERRIRGRGKQVANLFNKKKVKKK